MMDAAAANEIYQAIGRLEGSISSIYWFLGLGFTTLTVAAGSVGYLVYDLSKFVHSNRAKLGE